MIIKDIPLWAELLVLLIGIIFIVFALKCLKSGEAHAPWFLAGYHFKKEEHPVIYWVLLALWFGAGLILLIFAIILLLPF